MPDGRLPGVAGFTRPGFTLARPRFVSDSSCSVWCDFRLHRGLMKMLPVMLPPPGVFLLPTPD
eukprot:6578177-Prymnesium_polylepis.2